MVKIPSSLQRLRFSDVIFPLFLLSFVLLFGVLGVSSLAEILRSPDAPSVLTTAQLAKELRTHHEVWVIIPNPRWDCSTLVHTTYWGQKSYEEADTEVFIRDRENSIAILATLIGPKECTDLDRAQVVGIASLMSEKHIENLKKENRFATVLGYRTMIEFCTYCGKRSSIMLLVISVIMEVLGLGLIALMVAPLLAGRRTKRRKKYNKDLKK